MSEIDINAAGTRYSKNVLYYFKKDKLALLGGIIVIFFTLIGIFAPYIAPHSPIDMNLQRRLIKPSLAFPLGTDQLGRCTLSRLIYGTRTSFGDALIVLAGILAIGVPLGILAGYVGGWVDNFIMRLADIVLTFPSSLVALAVVGILGPGILNIMLVLVFLWWAPFARIIRGTVLKLKEMDFVMAAKAAGTSKFNIIVKHILLNAVSPIIVLSTLKVASIITHIAGFSFIGLGTQPPTADWGIMLSDSRQFISSAPSLMVWPGLTIMTVVFGLNMFGEGLNEALRPSLN
ncbi:glutathione transport system permease protein GsiD [Clostridium ragsdalei P11]|uniref:Glutathione transport system permease protein GsiD n=1 Tax=Clostridium ragsdalei P11 TaxID=1353534 RepID=A0A1A6B455_9CLOT|nr:ABC transporter permease subunit [Clostridium ragsdalei]OBR97124.1 glutathione transport system permease protein GsiD [Clostridium ragsdalei P11]